MQTKMGIFKATKEVFNKGKTLRYRIHDNGHMLSYSDVIENWICDDEFRSFFCSLLIESGLNSYVWETPPITVNHVNRPFEFVLVGPSGHSSFPDHDTFAQYFDIDAGDNGVVSFDNLGKDALLVVPSPNALDADYSNLAAFLINAPKDQHHALWRVIGNRVKQHLRGDPLWISVAGGGVAWLHVRLDTYPKYYRYAPYRVTP